MSITRLTCRKCLVEFDYDSPITCKLCNEKISPLVCVSCHNKTHRTKMILAYKYRKIAGVQLIGIFCWSILLFGVIL